MYRPLALFIGLRYLQGKRRNRFATFVSFASMLGIGIGVAVLVIVLSVMNGFEREVASHILGMTSHATVFKIGEAMDQWQETAADIRRKPYVTGVQPFIRGSAMINRRGQVRGIVVYGIPEASESEVSDLSRYLDGASLSSLKYQGKEVSVFLGSTLAEALKVKAEDSATLIIPRWTPAQGAKPPLYQPVTVRSVFHIGMHEFDSAFVLMDLPAAAKFFEYGSAVTGLRIKFDRPELALKHATDLKLALGSHFLVLDWSQFHQNFFQALKSQKRILFLILSLIIAVAAFNVVASMIMIVKEKRRDIAILRTQGCSSRTILAAFVLQGVLIGACGILIGLALGITCATYANDLLQWLERIFDIHLIKADVYYINYLPTKIEAFDLFLVTGTTMMICLLATVYPAYRASQVEPVEALRYE